MDDQIQDYEATKYFIVGLLIGGFAGVTAALLMAPQSGKTTRDKIQLKSLELRKQATETAEGTLAQVRETAQQVSGDVRNKAGELQQRGQDTFDEQRERLATFVEGRNKDIEVSE